MPLERSVTDDTRGHCHNLTGFLVECCFTSTETVGVLGMGAQDGPLDFRTVSKSSK